jgi:nucleotide-binding universal stress UspA family protein
MCPEHPSRLLVPLDGSSPAEATLEIAEVIVGRSNAEIHVLFVSEEALPADAVASRARVPDRWLRRVHLHGARGEAAASILKVARDIGAHAVLLSSHGVTRNLNVPAGHVTIEVLQDPPCPAYVVRSALSAKSQAHRLRHLRRILVPLDGTSEAAQAIEGASALALQAGARLLMLHVLTDKPELVRAQVVPVYSDQSHYELEAWEEEFVRSSFSRTAKPREVRAEVALRCGEPGLEIARYARDEDCDLIVAAWGGRLSPGRAQVVRTLLGATDCPLLFLRAHTPAGR